MDNKGEVNVCQGVGRDVSCRNIAGRQGHSAHATTSLRNPQLAGSSCRRPILQLRPCKGSLSPQTGLQIDKIVCTRITGGIKHLVK